MRKILLKNGKIFDGEQFLYGSVLTEGEKITAIGEVEAPADALVIHASGCIVCPGLVDIHTHLSEMSGEPFGFPAALATIPFGVTAAVDHLEIDVRHLRNGKKIDAEEHKILP